VLYIALAALASGFLSFTSRMCWRIRTIRTTCMLHSSQGLQLCSSCLHSAWRCLCLSSADSYMPHSDLCLALRFCHLLQYRLRFGYIACRCICFAIIIFYMSEIYCPIFTLSSTMPSVLHILGWGIVGLWCLFLFTCIVGTDLSAAITWVSLGLSAAEPHALQLLGTCQLDIARVCEFRLIERFRTPDTVQHVMSPGR
jgi:hypothetical protein